MTFLTWISISSPLPAEEGLDGLRPLVLGDGGVGQRGVEEVQGLGVALLDGGAHPGEVLRHELRQEVLELGRLALRLVRQRVVLDGLGAADVVDPNDQRLQGLVLLDGPEVQRRGARRRRPTRTAAQS